MAHYDVVGIGNAIVDILAHVQDGFLEQHGMAKGGMHLVEAEAIDRLRAGVGEIRACSGGSVANSMAALAELGLGCAFIGRVAEDAMGDVFVDDMRKTGIKFTNAPVADGKPTARCMVCVTPDGERTMNTYIGASAELTKDDIDEAMIANAGMLYIEGYLWDAPLAKDAIRHAIALAKESGAKVAFTASDTFCVERHHDEFVALIAEHVDVLFANEAEITALYGLPAEQAAQHVQQYVEVAAITRSDAPAIIVSKDEITAVATQPLSVVDATGAGDLFAAGFLYGLAKHWSYERAAQQGHKLASHIIGQLGARSTSPLQELVA